MATEPSPALLRLAHSRSALVERMRGKSEPLRTPGTAGTSGQDSPVGATRGVEARAGSATGTSGKWSLARHVLHTWWRRHPVSIATDLAQPALASYAHRRPLKLLGYAVVAGAAIAVLRPWRIVPVTALLATVLKTSDLAAVAAAMITPQKDTPRKE